MKKIVLTLFIAGNIFAQTAGESGLSFLKIGFGARNIALGDIGVVSADGVSALNYNPALLRNYKSPEFILTHTEVMQDVRSELFGVSFSMFGLPFAFGLNATTVSDIEIRTQPGEAVSTFNVSYYFGSLSTGFKLYDNLSAGITFKYLVENIYTDEASGYGFDFGLHYADLIENLNLGFSIRNLGSMSALRNESTKLPVDLRFGADYLIPAESLKSEIYIAAGFQKYTASDENHFNLGGEFFYDNLIAARLGYVTGYESKGLSFGLGLRLNKFDFDYAFVPLQYELGSSHVISIKFTL